MQALQCLEHIATLQIALAAISEIFTSAAVKLQVANRKHEAMALQVFSPFETCS